MAFWHTLLQTGGYTAASSVVSQAATGFMNGPALFTSQASLANSPFLLPSPETIIDLMYKGRLSVSGMNGLLAMHGIPVVTPNEFPMRRELWTRTIEEMRPLPELEQIRRAFLTGEVSAPEFSNYLKRHKLASNPDWGLFVNPMHTVTGMEGLQLLNQGFVNELQLRTLLNRNGINRTQDQDLFMRLRYAFPTHSDLIPMAVREVFSPDIVARFNYDAEFPETFQFWMDKVGYGWKPSDLGYTVPASQDITWPQALWRAHWQMMSPTQAGHAVHFLRPRQPGDTKSRRPGIPAFTIADHDTILRIADYPPIIRQWLYGLSFTPLGRIDIRRMFRLGVVSPEEVFELYRDLGYDERNAGLQRDFVIADTQKTENSRDRARIETALRNGYEMGFLDRRTAAAGLHRVRLFTDEQRTAFNALPSERQFQTALANPSVDLILNTIDLNRQMRYAKAAIKAVRRAATRREIDVATAQRILGIAGVQSEEIARLVDLWNVENLLTTKTATIAQVLRWLTRGAIQPADATERLRLLNVPPRDINIMLGLAGQDRQLQIAREQERNAATLNKRAQAQMQQLEIMRRERNRIIGELNRSATKAQILRFLTRGYISVAEAYSALLQRGVFPLDAYAFVLDAIRHERSKYEAEIADLKKKANADETTRTGTNNGNPQLPSVP